MKNNKTALEILQTLKNEQEFKEILKALFGKVKDIDTIIDFTDKDRIECLEITLITEDETQDTLDFINFTEQFEKLIEYLNQNREKNDIRPIINCTNLAIKTPELDYRTPTIKVVDTNTEIKGVEYEVLVFMGGDGMYVEISPTEYIGKEESKYNIEIELEDNLIDECNVDVEVKKHKNGLTREDKEKYNQLMKQINTIFNKNEELYQLREDKQDFQNIVEELKICKDEEFINSLFKHNIDASLNTKKEVYLTIQHTLGQTIPRIKYLFIGNNFTGYMKTYTDLNKKLAKINFDIDIDYVDKSQMLRESPKVIEHSVKKDGYSKYTEFFDNYFFDCIEYDGEKPHASKRIEICLNKGKITDIITKYSNNRTYFVNEKHEIVAECKTRDLKADAELLKEAINKLLIAISK